MFECYFEGKMVIPSHDAIKDIIRHKIPPNVVNDIIECGEKYKDGKMSRGEKGLSKRYKKEIVFIKSVPLYSIYYNEEVWVMKHVGKKMENEK